MSSPMGVPGPTCVKRAFSSAVNKARPPRQRTATRLYRWYVDDHAQPACRSGHSTESRAGALQLELGGPGRDLGSGVEPQLRQDVLDVVRGRALRDDQGGRDVPIRET